MPSQTRRSRTRRPARRPVHRPARRGRGTSPAARVGSRFLGFGAAIGIGAVVVLAVTIALAAGAADLGSKFTSALGPAGSSAGSGTAAVVCPKASPVQVGTVLVPAGPIDGYCQDRLVNAAHIINAARALGIGNRTQQVAVMTAMGESSLRNIDHGDTAGPDSRGLFQQRDNGAWGTYSDRMTPYIAATHFFDKLVKVPGWQTMEPTILAHTVQVNADPNHYASYWPAAVAVVDGLTSGKP